MTAASAGLTLLVIAITAFAALRQMAHMRVGNQVALFTAYNTEWDSPQFSKAFAFVRTLRADELDEEALQGFVTGSWPGELHSIRLIANFFEDMGAFVYAGILSKDIVCTLYSSNVQEVWECLAPIVYYVREGRKTQAIWEFFEYLAVASEDHIAAHPAGTYPPGMRRMRIDVSLVKKNLNA
ncbi:MAG TPA: hypothetical protein VFW34_04735 [Candidatus Rubrimentiphilum sp.]|nr:hypothetical protein [Candidatus Rubrimentiphilum sp.]